MVGASKESRERLRWRLADEAAGPQQALFEDEPPTWRAGHGEFRGLEFLEVKARRVINPVPPQSRVSFRYTINAYRGCSHACSFCFARPTHEYLNLNAGEDFERRIVVKVNAVERVRAEVRAKRWAGDLIAMGTNTDPYQRCEGKYRLTRGIEEVLAEARNPFSILTKSTLILRDIEVLAEAAKRTSVHTAFSVGSSASRARRIRGGGSRRWSACGRPEYRRAYSPRRSCRESPTARSSYRHSPMPWSRPECTRPARSCFTSARG
jgi:hypothetical protein